MKRLFNLFLAVVMIFSFTCIQVYAANGTGGSGNIDGGGGSMGDATSHGSWNPGNEGVRVTVVRASDHAVVTTPFDLTNKTPSAGIYHFGKVSKIQYNNGTGLSPVQGGYIDWVYSQLVGFFGNFFAEMGNMGVELFEMSWVQSIVLFFSYLAWTMYVVGLVVAVFEVGIEYQTGRASIKDAAISAVKGFMAVGCFTLVPVELYKLSVTLQASLTSGITGYGESFDALSTDIINSLQGVDIGAAASSGVFGGIGSITSPIMVIFIIIMMGYAVIKCFFSNLKRGGVLLIQIAVGSLYMFSVPRGYMDGFVQWCKQIIGLCLTTFLQATILTAGLLVLKDHALLGLGLMLSAGEVPRICGAFGLDTSTRANIMSAVYAAQSAVNTTRTVVQAVGAAK